jgi:predicted nucleic acid-binding protein
MTELSRGLLDTSVVIDLDAIDSDRLPETTAIAAVTLAELAKGPHATADANERARPRREVKRKLQCRTNSMASDAGP